MSKPTYGLNELIGYVETHRKGMIGKGRARGWRVELLEDAYTVFLLKLMEWRAEGKEIEIERLSTYAYSAFFRAIINHNRRERKYIPLEHTAKDTLDGYITELSMNNLEALLNEKSKTDFSDLHDQLDLLETEREFERYVAQLPNGQRAAVMRRFRGEHDKTNTEKAHFRWGFLKLKELLSGERQ